MDDGVKHMTIRRLVERKYLACQVLPGRNIHTGPLEVKHQVTIVVTNGSQ